VSAWSHVAGHVVIIVGEAVATLVVSVLVYVTLLEAIVSQPTMNLEVASCLVIAATCRKRESPTPSKVFDPTTKEDPSTNWIAAINKIPRFSLSGVDKVFLTTAISDPPHIVIRVEPTRNEIGYPQAPVDVITFSSIESNDIC